MNYGKKKKRMGRTSPLSEVLAGIIGEYNLEKLFTIESIKGVWSEIVGDIISSHSIPEKIQNGIIYIAADHSVFSNEIILMKDRIIKDISEKNMNIKIKDMRVNIKRLDWTK